MGRVLEREKTHLHEGEFSGEISHNWLNVCSTDYQGEEIRREESLVLISSLLDKYIYNEYILFILILINSQRIGTNSLIT